MNCINSKGLIFPKLIYKNFNIIEQLDIDEPQHSKILGFILNLKGKHGFGNIFLKEFFDIVVADNNFVWCDTEKWFVTVEKGRFDISIKNRDGSKRIIIENKSNWAEDQPNQLYRYWLRGIYQAQYWLQKHDVPVFAKIIYLSPSYEKRYSEQSITRPEKADKNLPETVKPKDLIKIVYFRDEIVRWLEKCMSKIAQTDVMYFYLKQYADYWRNSMTNETINQVEEFFSDKEQWLSFWYLAKRKDEIRDSWWRTLKSSVDKYFNNVDNSVEGWGYTSWETDHTFRWFLKEFDKESLRGTSKN